MPLKLPRLQKNKYNVGKMLPIKFLGALLMKGHKDKLKYLS